MRSTTIKMLAGVAALSLALSACSGGSGSGGASAKKTGTQSNEFKAEYNKQPVSNLKEGGTLSRSIAEITPQLNVFEERMTSDTRTLWTWYNPTLITFTETGDMVLNKDYLVEAKDSLKDGKTIVNYKINEKATYNDGTPIDYRSFVNTWKSNKGEQGYISNSTDGYVLIESVEKGATDKDVVVTFKQPYPWWGSLFNNILHPAVDSADKYTNAYVGGTTASAHPEWGAGPYKLESLNEQEGIVTFVPNEKWWGENKAKLTKVTIQRRETVAALNAFKNGETDVTGANSNEHLSQIKSMQGIDIRRGATPAIYMVTLNSEGAILKDINIRKAVATGINRAQLAQVRFNGLDYSEALPGSIALYPYQKGYQDNFSKVVPKFDTAAAEKILDEAGWKKGSDGIREKDGTKLTLSLPMFGDSQLTKALGQAIQAQMKAIGIDLKIVSRASNDFSKVTKARDFDLLISGFRSTDSFGVAYFCQTYCSDTTLNKSKTGTAELDAKIKAMEKLPTAEEQTAKANEIEVEALGTFGLIPLYSGVTIFGAKKGLANVGSGVYATDANGFPIDKTLIGYQK